VSKFSNAVAIITGGAQGQGAAEARRLASEGCRIVIGDVVEDLGKATAESLGSQARFVRLDVSNEDDWGRAVVAAEEMGPIRVLVNNAGLCWLRALEEETPETMERMWRVNLLGAFNGIRACAPAMRRAGGGSIINVSSVAGLMGMAFNTAYGTTKWALRGLTQTAAVELGPDGIRVNCVIPGPINTGMLPSPPPGVSVQERYRHLPVGRVGETEDVASLVAFLASDESGFITGADYVIDGGFRAGPPRPSAAPA
jgi:3alpha(or 20beta)-hydroxysteroid dehydrogenase